MRGGKRAGAGRPAGVKDSTPRGEHKTLSARACAIHGIDPFEVAAMIAKGELPCMVCRGKGKTKYQPARGEIKERTCESCYGSGREKIAPRERLLAAKFLGDKQEGNRISVQHSGDEDSPLRHTIKVRFVKPDATHSD